MSWRQTSPPGRSPAPDLPTSSDAGLLDGYSLRDQFVRQTPSGHEVVGRAPGVVAAGLPAYWFSHPDSMSLVPGAVTAALLIALALVLLFSLLAREVPLRTALVATIGFGFTTPVWSIAANGLWPHTLTVVGIIGMAWAARSERWWLLGMFGGVAMSGRLHTGLIVAVVGILIALWRRDRRIATRVGAISGAMLIAMCAWNSWVYESWDPTAAYNTSQFSDYAGDRGLSLVNQLGFWISPDRGILTWTPALLLLAAPVFRSWQGLPDWSRALVWGGLAYTVFQGFLDPFMGGAAFYGNRLGLEMLACLAPAVLLSLSATTQRERLLLGPVLALQFCAIAMGAINDMFYLPAGDAWTANAFVTLIAEAGIIGWILVLVVAAVGAWAGRLWVAAPRPVAGPIADQTRGTVSSHSVP